MSFSQHCQQIFFAPNSDEKLQLSKSTTDSVLSLEDQVVAAEILQALHVVEPNQYFASSNGDSERLKRMFPDSEIAAKYAQHVSKTRYVINYGVAPHVKEALISDAKDTFLLLQI